MPYKRLGNTNPPQGTRITKARRWAHNHTVRQRCESCGDSYTVCTCGAIGRWRANAKRAIERTIREDGYIHCRPMGEFF